MCRLSPHKWAGSARPPARLELALLDPQVPRTVEIVAANLLDDALVVLNAEPASSV